MREQSVTAQGLRYLAVGVAVFLLDLGVFSALLALAPPFYLVANLAAKAAGAAAGFVLHKRFTFSWRQGDGWLRQLTSYAGVALLSAGLSTGLLGLLADGAGLPPLAAKLGADAVAIATAFVLGRTVVFRGAADPLH